MNICRGCGGVLGRDCYNEYDCVQIANSYDNDMDKANRFVQALVDTGWELRPTQQLLIMEKYINTF
jgi:hypothetical protein